VSTVAVVADVLILAWLVGTWFYEGHHKRCIVETTCPECAERSAHGCAADARGNWHA
jgi:hypothetical protein